MKTAIKALCSLISIFLTGTLIAQQPVHWRVHDLNRPQPQVINPPAQYLPVSPPSDAVVLFGGKESIKSWQGTDGKPTKWVCKDDYFECVKGSGYIQTKQGFGDVQLHVEWATPTPPNGKSQGRGNSGVFLMGRYEVQVLDSYQNKTYPDGQAGAVYWQYPPQVNAARPAGEWQSYDIIFHRPRFNNLGQLSQPARMTVFHNGVLIQDNVTLWGGTDWLKYREYSYHPDRLPLSLQDHGNPVRYRNIWVRNLEKIVEQPATVVKAKIELDPAALEKYAGTYKKENDGIHKIEFQDGKLWLLAHGSRRFELLPQSKELFSARFTAIDVKFLLDANGTATAMEYIFTGHTEKAVRVQ